MNLEACYPPPRPRGSRPFKYMALLLDWILSGCSGPCPVDLVTVKKDGFQFIVAEPTPGVLWYFTKSGLHITRNSSGKMGELVRVYERCFSHIRPSLAIHPTYGRAIAIFAELSMVRDDAVANNSEYSGDLDDLRAMFHGKEFGNRRFCFETFWCSFARDNPSINKRQRAVVSWAQRLDLCRRAFGPAHVVPTLIDARKPVTEAMFKKVEECYRFAEGLVILADGVIRKDKAPRPVDMQLVAVGLSQVDALWLPTHFFWSVLHEGVYYVPLVEDRSFLFAPGRAAKGKIELSASMFAKEGGRFRCLADNYQGHAFNALFALMGDHFVTPTQLSDHEAVLPDGRKVVIEKNRSMTFSGLQVRFLARPTRGVVGCNQLWMTGKESYSVAKVHFQAPQFLASISYGDDVYRQLLDNEHPTPASVLVDLSTVISRDLHAHARAVYGPTPVNLIYGDELAERSECSTPRTDCSSDAERREEVDGESDPEPLLADVRARRAVVNKRKAVLQDLRAGKRFH